MNIFNNQSGQGLIECLLALTLLVVITVSLSRLLVPAIDDHSNSLKLSRQVTWERLRNPEKTHLSGRYRLNSYFGRLIEPIDRLVPVNLERDNLRVTNLREINTHHMVRLTDSWETKEQEGLVSRPAALVVNNALGHPIMRTVQNGIGFIFLAKELKADSLIFGHIDSNVVPDNALIER
ncbi:hypothetical protein [Idiomarina sp.]|jgi:hypothetical protein|uniref:hypothetical protein n=1 Tax=Idiomarina sp. TaxID=1874361 RepID=UPI001DB4D277|nr:hypothetical protein [Idiomarina sp.]MCJ8315681.1 hypothetical protein [Idiomarina sp.]NQZ15596.1 hypothetical protein [Idiomarina sp.]|tara:strand:+ start:1967 stop:2503 length:537 start_codon:yes stop_codon:yes gene_type:complete